MLAFFCSYVGLTIAKQRMTAHPLLALLASAIHFVPLSQQGPC